MNEYKQTRLDVRAATLPQQHPPHYYVAPDNHPKLGDPCARCGHTAGAAIHLPPRAS